MKAALRIVLFGLASVGLLIVLALGVVTAIGYTEAGTRWVLARALPRLNAGPDMQVQWGAVEGTLVSGLRVRDLRLDSALDSGRIALRIDALQFAWQPWRLLDGALVLQSVRIDGLDYAADSDPEYVAEPLTPAALQDMLFALPFTIELQELAGSAIALRFDATPFAFDALTGSVLLDGERLRLVDLVWQQGATRITGTVELQAVLTLSGELAWQTRVAERDYAGTLTAGGSLQELQLTHQLTVPLQLASSGTVVPGMFAGEDLHLDLRHSFADPDLAAFGQFPLRLPQGSITTTGSPDALAIAGNVDAAVEGFAILNLAFSVNYAPDSISIDSIALTSSEIDLAASGTLLPDPLTLDLGWTLNALDVGDRLGDVQLLEVSGAGRVNLLRTDESLDGTLTLDGVQGLLNGYPLALTGNVELVNSGLAGIDLQAQSQDNSLSLTGSAADALDLQWELQAPALAQLWQGLAGAMVGTGTITGTPETPQVAGRLEGQQLSLQRDGSRIALSAFTLDAVWGDAGNDIRLELGALALQNAGDIAVRQLLQRGALALTGTPERHDLTADFAAAEGELALTAQGGTTDTGWQGSLQTAGLTSIYGDWQLEDAVALAWLDGGFTVAENCWSYSPTRLCLSAAGPAGAGIDADLDLTDLPLAWLNSDDNGVQGGPASPNPQPPGLRDLLDSFGFSLPAGLRTEGSVDMQLAVRNLAGASWDSLEIRVQPEDAVLEITQVLESETETLAPLVLRFAIYDTVLTARNAAGLWNAELAFQVGREDETGRVNQGSFTSNVAMTEAGDLDGTLNLAFNDLAWLESFAPVLRAPSGMLEGRALLSGNRANPQLDVQLQLQDGRFGLPAYGLDITGITVNARTVPGSAGNEALTVDATASSGAGLLTLEARIDNPMQDNRSFTASLGGENFLAFNADYARVTLSPDLQLDYTGTDVSVAGRITVPEMDIDLAGLLGDVGADAVPVSRDVVIVRTATGEDALALQREEALPLNVNVMLVLGDAVRLRGFGLDATLNGDLALEQTPNRPLLVYGELGIPEGSYEIYNQTLNTRDGRLIFFGNPANPVVDIRAYRETRTAEVGMILSGNIDNMQGQLYSTPTLPDNEILALLITGKSFNNVNDQDGDALLSAIANFGFERGEGLTESVSSKLGLDSVTVGGGDTLGESALGLGKYLTPNLLMSYKVGLFDRQSILSIDYTLSERLKLEVETGISQSIEISYTIEKD